MSFHTNPTKIKVSEIIAVALICFGCGTTASALWLLAFKIPFSTEQILLLTENQAILLGWANVLQQFFFFMAPWLWFMFRSNEFNLHFRKNLSGINFPLLILLFGVTLSSFGPIEWLSQINQIILDSLPNLKKWVVSENNTALIIQEKLLTQSTTIGIFQTVVIMSIVPGIFEEFFFRGTLLHSLRKKLSPTKAIWIVAFVFAFIHFEWEGFIPRLILGAGLGYLYHWTNNLWYSVVAHIANNAMSILLFHYFKNLSTPQHHWSAQWPFLLCYTLLFMLLLFGFYRKTQVLNNRN